MNFNSVVFLFCFMPLALGLYYLVPGRVKNAVLLVESLLFSAGAVLHGCRWPWAWLPSTMRRGFCLPACPPGASEKSC